MLLSRSPCAPVVPRDHKHSWEAAQLIGLSLAVAVNTFVHTRSTGRGRSNHDLNAFLAPGRPAERRLGIRAIGTPQVAMGDQPNRPDNAQDQHDHEIPVTRVPQYVFPEA